MSPGGSADAGARAASRATTGAAGRGRWATARLERLHHRELSMGEAGVVDLGLDDGATTGYGMVGPVTHG
ncbi:MAG TPA: hypothetical protein VIX85_03275 [Acidimicrobiales bacterium]